MSQRDVASLSDIEEAAECKSLEASAFGNCQRLLLSLSDRHVLQKLFVSLERGLKLSCRFSEKGLAGVG